MGTPYQPGPDQTLPPGIIAHTTVQDTDPPIDYHFTRVFDLFQTKERGLYSGSSYVNPEMVRINALRSADHVTWLLQLWVWAVGVPGERFDLTFTMPRLKNNWPFPKIQNTAIPGKDLQIIELKA